MAVEAGCHFQLLVCNTFLDNELQGTHPKPKSYLCTQMKSEMQKVTPAGKRHLRDHRKARPRQHRSERAQARAGGQQKTSQGHGKERLPAQEKKGPPRDQGRSQERRMEGEQQEAPP